MNLNLAWSNPSPTPNCGFKAQYRRKGDPSYTEIDTSGTTLAIPIAAPANYEGRILCDCCDVESSGTPFGVNSYVAISVSAATDDLSRLIVTISSDFGSPYDTIIAGSVTLNLLQVFFSVTYDAGNTTQDFNLGVRTYPPNTSAPSVVNAVSPIFNNGGELQQFDTVNTPPYFKFYWDGDVSGTTWTGSPADLPSFTLDAFSVTETDPSGTIILAGSLNMSYILHDFYSTVYTAVIIEVFDPLDVSPIGTIILNTSPLGLRTTTISLTKGSSPLTTATGFIMKTFLPDLTLLDTKTFYLPS